VISGEPIVAPKVGGPFTLTDHEGRTVTEADFHGRFMLVYFGYTYCPDICPTSLQSLSEALDLLKPEQVERVTPVLISVDPERDTPEQLKDYVSNFHEKLVGLTGTAEQIADVGEAYRVFTRRVDGEDGYYFMDHTALFYLMGPEGKYRAHMPHSATPERLAERLRPFL